MSVALQGLMCKRRRGGSTEPITWTERTSNFGNYVINSLRAGSDGNWVAGGGYGGSHSLRVTTNDTTNPTDAWTENTIQATYWGENGLDYDGTYWCLATDNGSNAGVYTATNPTSTWTFNSLVNNLSGLKYANSLWVAGRAAGGEIYTSTTPNSTWTSRGDVLTGSRTFDISYDGSSYWVAVGADHKIAYSTSPTTSWTSATAASPFAGTILGVEYGNGYWVAVGASGELATCHGAPSGTWTLHGTSSFGASDAIRGIAYGNNAWVAVGDDNKIATCHGAPTGTWTQRTTPFDGTGYLGLVRYYNGYWVCAGIEISAGPVYNGVIGTAVSGT